VNVPRKFRTRFSEAEKVTIEEKLSCVLLGRAKGETMQWCKENLQDVGKPCEAMRVCEIHEMASSVGLKALETERIERAFLRHRHWQLPIFFPCARPVLPSSLNQGTMNVMVKMGNRKAVEIYACPEDTIAMLKVRMQLLDSTLCTRPFNISFEGDTLNSETWTLDDCGVKPGSELLIERHGKVLAQSLGEAMCKADLSDFQNNASIWCSQLGASCTDDVRAHFDHFCTFLQLMPAESIALRRQLGVSSKPIEDMSLEEISIELAVDTAQFRQNSLMLAKMRRGTAEDVAKHLFENSVLLTATQAQRLFSVLLPKITSQEDDRYSPRSQLVMLLHYFCVEPYVAWEDDGSASCLWINMSYNGHRPWKSGLCQDVDGKPLGEERPWGSVKEHTCRAGCGFYPGKDGYCSLCRAGNGPNFPDGRRPESVEEARKTLRQDISELREALKMFRSSKNRQDALERIVKPMFHGEHVSLK
jgi:hypothetical protein